MHHTTGVVGDGHDGGGVTNTDLFDTLVLRTIDKGDGFVGYGASQGSSLGIRVWRYGAGANATEVDAAGHVEAGIGLPAHGVALVDSVLADGVHQVAVAGENIVGARSGGVVRMGCQVA